MNWNRAPSPATTGTANGTHPDRRAAGTVTSRPVKRTCYSSQLLTEDGKLVRMDTTRDSKSGVVRVRRGGLPGFRLKAAFYVQSAFHLERLWDNVLRDCQANSVEPGTWAITFGVASPSTYDLRQGMMAASQYRPLVVCLPNEAVAAKVAPNYPDVEVRPSDSTATLRQVERDTRARFQGVSSLDSILIRHANSAVVYRPRPRRRN